MSRFVRKIVTQRQQAAAYYLVVEGWSAVRALRAAGYGWYTSRNFSQLLRGSWGLRQAIADCLEQHKIKLRPRPARKKYARRSIALAVNAYCNAETQAGSRSQAPFLHKREKEAKRVAQNVQSEEELILGLREQELGMSLPQPPPRETRGQMDTSIGVLGGIGAVGDGTRAWQQQPQCLPKRKQQCQSCGRMVDDTYADPSGMYRICWSCAGG